MICGDIRWRGQRQEYQCRHGFYCKIERPGGWGPVGGLAKRNPPTGERDGGLRLRLIGPTNTDRYDFAFSRQHLPEVLHFVYPRSQRAQGRPGARCTRGLAGCCKRDRLPTSIQVQRRASGLPCTMALRLIRDRPGDRLSCHHRSRATLAAFELDASTGASDPNDFAVRTAALVNRDLTSTAIPSRACDDRETPSEWNGTGICNVDLGSASSKISDNPKNYRGPSPSARKAVSPSR